MKYTDEQLSAFLDGELSEADMNAIEKAIEVDPQLLARLEALTAVDERLKETFAPVTDAPIPASILAMLDEKPDEQPTNIVSFSDHKNKRNLWQFPTAIAASLMIGFFASQTFVSNKSSTIDMIATGPVNPDSKLYAALSSLPSGESRDGLTPLLSFKSSDGNYCREFTSPTSRGLACGSRQGWTVISQSHAPQNGTSGGYATASAESSEAFDSLVDSLMKDDVLSTEQEKALIQKKWQK